MHKLFYLLVLFKKYLLRVICKHRCIHNLSSNRPCCRLFQTSSGRLHDVSLLSGLCGTPRIAPRIFSFPLERMVGLSKMADSSLWRNFLKTVVYIKQRFIIFFFATLHHNKTNFEMYLLIDKLIIVKFSTYNLLLTW